MKSEARKCSLFSPTYNLYFEELAVFLFFFFSLYLDVSLYIVIRVTIETVSACYIAVEKKKETEKGKIHKQDTLHKVYTS